MTDVTNPGFTALALQLGIAVLLFGALIIFSAIVKHWIKSDRVKWSQELVIREKKNQADKEMLTSLIEKNYEILRDSMRDSREQIQVMTRLVDRVKNMQEAYDTAFRDLFDKHDEFSKRPSCAETLKQIMKV